MLTNNHTDYGIWLSYNNQQEGFRIPVNPPDISIGDSGGGKTYEVSGLGEINVIQSPKLTDISFKSVFPVNHYAFVASQVLYEPVYYVNLILNWMKTKHPIRLVFTGASFDLNMAVSIEKFEWSEIAGSSDIEYSIGLKKFVFYGARKVILDNNQTGVKKKASRPSDRQSPKTYRMAKGDTLIKVAKQQLGSATLARDIKRWNKIKDWQLLKKDALEGKILKLKE
ncbi:peptidoglycan-binding protein LysM [Paenibacillus harenae]|uniref:peptidoglycan-binding protein LysM n=1 Tax=Paenibacillus harenae TaxID=306543 RepID=UPI0027914A00|nr:peptidoglycan-binding protein LysM [Paenibacillus harenae]MDQ0063559.1 LysM repeat protein [Paenibacillus harenae]